VVAAAAGVRLAPVTHPDPGGGERRFTATPLGVGVVAALVAAVLAAVFALVAGGPGGMVRAAPPWAHPGEVPSGVEVLDELDGFDGQFFYRVAADPLSDEVVSHGIEHDLPALRASRIGYPLVAWALSGGGRTPLLPWALVVANVLAVGLVAWAAGSMVADAGRSPRWGWLVAGQLGFVYSLSFDLAELWACGLGIAGLVALGRSRPWLAAALLAAAPLCRESALVFGLGAVAAGVLGWPPVAGKRAGRDRRLVITGAAAVGAFVAWQLVVDQRFGTLPVRSSAGNNIRFPFEGLWLSRGAFRPVFDPEVGLRFLALGFLLTVGVLGLRSLRRAPAPLAWAWLGSGVVLATVSEFLWPGVTGFSRAASEFTVLGLLLAVTTADPRRLRPWLPALAAATSLATVASQLVKL
jgi:hypothetical protein